MYQFVIGNTYTFNTRAAAVLGSAFKNAKILGLVDYTTACTYLNIDLMHRTIYPLLPAGTIDNPKKFTYLLVATESNEKTVIAYPWIDEASIVLSESATVTITLTNATTSDADKIRDTLTLMGYAGFKISID